MSDDIVKRLRRARGQVDGVISMYEEGRECVDVITQITAARAALASVGRELLTGEAVRCSRNSKHAKLDTLLKQLFSIS